MSSAAIRSCRFVRAKTNADFEIGNFSEKFFLLAWPGFRPATISGTSTFARAKGVIRPSMEAHILRPREAARMGAPAADWSSAARKHGRKRRGRGTLAQGSFDK